MKRWRFKSYISPLGVDLVKEWFDQQPFSVQAEFVDAALYLSLEHADRWEGKDYSDLQGRLSLLGELRVDVAFVHYRILGFRDIDNMEFTMLVGVKKVRDFSYTVPGNQALKRRLEVVNNPMRFSREADWISSE